MGRFGCAEALVVVGRHEDVRREVDLLGRREVGIFAIGNHRLAVLL